MSDQSKTKIPKKKAIKRSISLPATVTHQSTGGLSSHEDVDSDENPSKPHKQVRFEQSTKEDKGQKQQTTKCVEKLESGLETSTTPSGSKDKDSTDSSSDKDSSSSESCKRDSSGSENKETQSASRSFLSESDSDPSSVASDAASSKNPQGTDEKESTSDVMGKGSEQQELKEKPKRQPSIFDIGDVTSESSPSSNKSDDTTSSITF